MKQISAGKRVHKFNAGQRVYRYIKRQFEEQRKETSTYMCIYVGVHVFECICEYSALQADRVAAQRRTGAKRFAFFMPGLPRQLLKIFTCYLWGTHALGNEHANPASRTFLPLLSASICRFPSFSLTFSASYVLYLLIIQLLLPSLSFFSHHKKYSLVRARQSPGVFNEIFSLIL